MLSNSNPLTPITFLLNWRATPYHAPLFLAKSKGLFAEQGLKVAILEPSDPSDVTEAIGSGRADLGLKAMIHTLAAKARGHPVTSVGTLLDEPFTGLIYLRESGITDFASIRGKRIGYVGEFGKVQIDELCAHFGLQPSDYTAVRCGMHIADALIRGHIDAGIGLENVQLVQLEQWLLSKGRSPNEVQLLRIDDLAELGCCCFCSVLYIGNDAFLAREGDAVRRFLSACKSATDFLIASPEEAWRELVAELPHLDSALNRKMFERSFAYFSESMHNVQRDWTKVTRYAKRLGILDEHFAGPNFTNEFLGWKGPSEVLDEGEALHRQKLMAEHQRRCAAQGQCLRLMAQ